MSTGPWRPERDCTISKPTSHSIHQRQRAQSPPDCCEDHAGSQFHRSKDGGSQSTGRQNCAKCWSARSGSSTLLNHVGSKSSQSNTIVNDCRAIPGNCIRLEPLKYFDDASRSRFGSAYSVTGGSPGYPLRCDTVQ